MFSPISTVLAHIKSGQLKGLATTELKRSSELPDLPTVSEAGVKGFNTSVWLGFVAPSGTPQDVIDKLSKGINDALKEFRHIRDFEKDGPGDRRRIAAGIWQVHRG